MKLSVILPAMALVAVLPICAEAGAKERADKVYKGYPNVVRDLQYKQVPGFSDSEQLSMDLILPQKNLYRNGAPVVMYIHGGGWSGGERYVLGRATLDQYTSKGIAVACISYRLAKNGSSGLNCLIDCKDAARFLAKNASKYKLDPTRFATRGHSAGGHLSLCTALVPNDNPVLKGDPKLSKENPIFRSVFALAPQCTLFEPEQADQPGTITMKPFNHEKLLGGKSLAKPTEKEMASNTGREKFIYSIQTTLPIRQVARSMSPDVWLSKTSPPAVVVHGTTDSLISVRGAQHFKKIADKQGADLEYVEVEHGWHDFRSKDPKKTPSHSHKEIEEIGHRFLLDRLLKDIEKI